MESEKKVQVGFICTKEEREWLKEIAISYGMSVASWLRYRAIYAPDIEHDETKKIEPIY